MEVVQSKDRETFRYRSVERVLPMQTGEVRATSPDIEELIVTTNGGRIKKFAEWYMAYG